MVSGFTVSKLVWSILSIYAVTSALLLSPSFQISCFLSQNCGAIAIASMFNALGLETYLLNNADICVDKLRAFDQHFVHSNGLLELMMCLWRCPPILKFHHSYAITAMLPIVSSGLYLCSWRRFRQRCL